MKRRSRIADFGLKTLAAVGLSAAGASVFGLQSEIRNPQSAIELTPAYPLEAPKGTSVVAGRGYQGEELACDLPGAEQFKNIGSHLDGAGMCVFTSIEMALRWHGYESFRGFRDWCAAHYAGGGYPQKVDRLIAAYCKAKGCAPPPYIQYEGQDVAGVLALCDRTGRMACVTYGYSPRYGGGTIAHMTCCPKYSGRFAVCLDNNFVGTDRYEWMSRAEMDNRVKWPQGSGWVFVPLLPSPPPAPR